MNNLQLYHKIFDQLRQWWPEERVTRVRNEALLVMGLYLSKAVHMSHVVSLWPLPGKEPSLVNRLRRFLNNYRVEINEWYHPVIAPIQERKAGQPIRLVLDVTKVGFSHRMAMISLAYRRRTIPIMWTVEKGRKGHVAAHIHIEMLKEIRQWLPGNSPVEVVADSGYESVELLRWLRNQHWDLVLRAGGHKSISKDGEQWRKLGEFSLKPGQTRTIGWVRLTEQHNYGWLYLVLHWEKGEDVPWYLLTNREAPTHTIIRRYKRWMWIEMDCSQMTNSVSFVQAA